MPRLRDLTGQRFGRLSVVGRAPLRADRVHWTCRCDCGRVVPIAGGNLCSGNTTSCGCRHREELAARNLKHGALAGERSTPEYNSWASAKSRCYNRRNADYADYGGRGITMCETWRESFSAFFAAMGPRPSRTELDRIDNEGGYGPGNCRWATRTAQTNNRRFNHRLTHDRRTMSLADWARETGLSQKVLAARIARGWPPEHALTKPPRRSPSR